jgi:hypothetical protein
MIAITETEAHGSHGGEVDDLAIPASSCEI